MRLKVVAVITAAVFSLTIPSAQARMNGLSGFWSTLDRNGTLSAGWVDVLPVLASACGFTLDSKELNSILVDISQDNGNVAYAENLYSNLRLIEKGRSKNHFFGQWDTMFHGRQKEACNTAEALWGGSGRQFPGVLKREVSLDQTGSVPNADRGCR